MRLKTNLIFLTVVLSQTRADYGLVYYKASGQSEWQNHVCVTFNPYIHTLPADQDDAIHGMLKDFYTDFGCYDSKAYSQSSAAGDIVAVARGNCTFIEKTDMAEKHKAKGVIVVTDTYVLPGLNQTLDIGRFNITIASMLASDYKDIQSVGSSVELMMYSPLEEDKFDPCIVIIFALAVVCITIGGYWSGVTTMDRYKKKEEKLQKKKKSPRYVQSSDKDGTEDEKDEDEEHLDITVPAVLVFFVLVCTFLVLLYFYYDYLVFVIISLFCIAGSIGLFYCLLPFWKYIPVNTRIPKVPCCKQQPEIKSVVLYAMCAALAIVWAVERHQSYAWILQDILGVAFCVNMLKTIQVPNLKICSILLILLFLYDIFFVFITPYFTKNGESIMVKVATGGSGSGGGSGKPAERLPMVFVVPKLNSSPYSKCLDQPSMLGFGDVIVPGLLIGYNHWIDLKVGSKKIYYIATVIAYCIGMIITFVALELMKTGQPALLYLVPCTLITTFVIGCIRGEVKLLWNGVHKQVVNNTDNMADISETGTVQGPDSASVDQVHVEVSSTSTIDSENKSLIRK